MKRELWCASVLGLLFYWGLPAQNPAEIIRGNQIGFYPLHSKVMAVESAAADSFFIVNPENQKRVFTGMLGPVRVDQYSGKSIRLADFSAFQTSGTYFLEIPKLGRSFLFQIKPNALLEVAKASIKGFYYQRAGMELKSEFAGPWSRPAGHPDTKVQIHPSAATPERPEGMEISCPGGWYDAGDYNKYIVNSGITVATLLSLLEDLPRFADTLKIAIPEQSNRLPDLLDEILWNLRWMLTMQDPNDGGVYHKLTAAEFEGMVMPDKATHQRYVIQKSTAATLDFVAVTAQAARVLSKYRSRLPGLADSCLAASLKAWQWAFQHPDLLYRQGALNKQFDPDINTGAYGDNNVSDEWIWAACELFVTTRDRRYFDAEKIFPDTLMPLPYWGQVRLLGYYSLLRTVDLLLPNQQEKLKYRFLDTADQWLLDADSVAYAVPFGNSARDFVWGSNAVAANRGIAFLQAYLLTGKSRFYDGALAIADYLLGRNATGYSFVTGFGYQTPVHPHHRPSEADQVTAPVPGLLVGGPNPGRQDGCNYPTLIPDEAYLDDVCSYSTNEIAINWNAPLVYVLAALEAFQ